MSKTKAFSFCLYFIFSIIGFIAHPTFYSLSEDPPAVGMVITLSGNFATTGEDCRIGVDAALKETGNKLRFIYADTRNEPLTAIKELRALAEQNQIVAAFTNRSTIAMPLNTVSEKLRIPLLGAAGHKDFAANNPYAFQVWPRSDDEGITMAREMIKSGINEVTVIYSEDEWTGNVSENFIAEFKKAGGIITFSSPVLPTETDFRALITKIKPKISKALYINLLLPQIAPFVKQAKEMSVEAALFSNFYVSKTEVLTALGKEAEGIRYLDMQTELPKLKKTLGINNQESLPSLTVSAYVAAYSVINAVKEIKTSITSEAVYSALLNQKVIETPDYPYPVKNRYVKFPLVFKTLRALPPKL